MRLGFNFIGDAPGFDYTRALLTCDRLRPRWIVVINNLAFARDVAWRYPETNVIVRWVKADDNPLRSWPRPADFIDFARREIGDARLYANVANEAGFSDAVLQYFCDVIDLSSGLRLAVGGFSSGTPQPDDWTRPVTVELLRRLDRERGRVVLNLHEYCAGVMTSGLSNPPAVQPEAWPRPAPATRWHVGRWRFLADACARLGINPPRIVIGEFGHDDMSDIKAWLDTLIKTPPYQNIRGWKTLQYQFAAWYAARGWTAARALLEQYRYADAVLYDTPLVEGICDFAWCSPQSQWEQFDKSQADEFISLLTEYAHEDEGMPDIPAAGRYKVYPPAGTMNLRADAGTSAADIGDVNTGDTLTVTGETKTAGAYTWLKVQTATSAGWIALLANLRFEAVPDDTPPLTKAEALAHVANWRQTAASLQDAAVKLEKLAERLT